ncbi:hypothetical protein FA13DRAFT_1733511 [Coprinellus micaceus]|uniref:Uncharacterized protein n=1 Tax=Coprinellus micaceus TaxID=71717 RepID=A0A4Y7T915_COPMI|nr:hypothetical protein FA13DRAFT_1733511 [Coprinellus micaceus]
MDSRVEQTGHKGLCAPRSGCHEWYAELCSITPLLRTQDDQQFYISQGQVWPQIPSGSACAARPVQT